jgi:CRP-like cAMP-binding protein
MISLVTLMQEGTMVETAGVGFDNALGIGTALSGRIPACRAVVQLPLISLRISKANFNQAFAESAGVRAMAHQANELMFEQVQQSAACNALHDIEARLARWLLRCSDYTGGKQLRLTQEFMAQMLGVRRPTVTNIACSLQQRGFIDYTRGQLKVLDRASLEKLACECYAAPAEKRAAIVLRPQQLFG